SLLVVFRYRGAARVTIKLLAVEGTVGSVNDGPLHQLLALQLIRTLGHRSVLLQPPASSPHLSSPYPRTAINKIKLQ
ncbi:hypothetical protein PFISCL1PPCAC_16757, partial [Pristionchus fissidentatus]